MASKASVRDRRPITDLKLAVAVPLRHHLWESNRELYGPPKGLSLKSFSNMYTISSGLLYTEC